MKFLISILIVFSLFCVSCDRGPNIPRTKTAKKGQVRVWDGNNIVFRHKEFPVAIVWFKGDPEAWTPYKAFDQASEIKTIINLLDKPEVNEPRPELRSRNKLSMIYYDGDPDYLSVVELYFDVNDSVFVGPKGKSQELGKMLLAKEGSGLARYRFHTPPYDEERIDRAEKSEAYLREQVKKLKSQMPPEKANNIIDSNQQIQEANRPEQKHSE